MRKLLTQVSGNKDVKWAVLALSHGMHVPRLEQ